MMEYIVPVLLYLAVGIAGFFAAWFLRGIVSGKDKRLYVAQLKSERDRIMQFRLDLEKFKVESKQNEFKAVALETDAKDAAVLLNEQRIRIGERELRVTELAKEIAALREETAIGDDDFNALKNETATRIETLEKEIASNSLQIAKLESELDSEKARRVNFQKQFEDIDETKRGELNDLRGKLSTSEFALAKARSEVAKLRTAQQIAENGVTSQTNSDKIEFSRSQIAFAELESLKFELHERATQINLMQAQLGELQPLELKISEANRQNQKAMAEKDEQIEQLNSELRELQAMRERMQLNISQISVLEAKINEINDLRERAENSERLLKSRDEEIKALREQLAATKNTAEADTFAAAGISEDLTKAKTLSAETSENVETLESETTITSEDKPYRSQEMEFEKPLIAPESVFTPETTGIEPETEVENQTLKAETKTEPDSLSEIVANIANQVNPVFDSITNAIEQFIEPIVEVIIPSETKKQVNEIDETQAKTLSSQDVERETQIETAPYDSTEIDFKTSLTESPENSILTANDENSEVETSISDAEESVLPTAAPPTISETFDAYAQASGAETDSAESVAKNDDDDENDKKDDDDDSGLGELISLIESNTTTGNSSDVGRFSQSPKNEDSFAVEIDDKDEVEAAIAHARPTNEKFAAIEIDELVSDELPPLPKADRVRLQLQSPNRIFLYWDVAGNPFATLQRAFGERAKNYSLGIRLLNLENRTEKFYPAAQNGSTFFDVPTSAAFRADIGFYAENRPFIRLISSNILETPRPAPSLRTDVASDWQISTKNFAQVLGNSGFAQDALPMALSLGTQASDDDATIYIINKLTPNAPQVSTALDLAELRSVLATLSVGVAFAELREAISPALVVWFNELLRENPNALAPANVRSVLESVFGAEFLEVFAAYGDEEDAEFEMIPVAIGASAVRFSEIRFPKLRMPNLRFAEKLLPTFSNARDFPTSPAF
ncbi:MAG: DUF4912 domain-containing protein [Pyrinomonadaceae bacterium]|nr:DUF4912 domain-containing protein [Pyrinomonadaceae bacterium]